MAVSHALTVLGWSELSDEHQPSEDIWLDDDALAAHFELVKQKMRSKGSSSDDQWESIDDVGAQNELTKDLRKG